jgi:hypothetical protein
LETEDKLSVSRCSGVETLIGEAKITNRGFCDASTRTPSISPSIHPVYVPTLQRKPEQQRRAQPPVI